MFYPRRQQIGFPRSRGRFKTFQLRNHCANGIGALDLCIRRHTLPAQQETQKIFHAHRLDFLPQTFQCVAMNARQQTPLAPFFLRRRWRKAATQHHPFALQRHERDIDLIRFCIQWLRQRGRRHRTERREAATQNFNQRTFS